MSSNETNDLKVLTHEKRGGLKVVAFERSPYKLFTLRFSNKSVQAASCERRRTAQRGLFLSFEINNCFQISAQFQVKIKILSTFSFVMFFAGQECFGHAFLCNILKPIFSSNFKPESYHNRWTRLALLPIPLT
jgi:hypothetical protein